MLGLAGWRKACEEDGKATLLADDERNNLGSCDAKLLLLHEIGRLINPKVV